MTAAGLLYLLQTLSSQNKTLKPFLGLVKFVCVHFLALFVNNNECE
jgi:hypothetical protein